MIGREEVKNTGLSSRDLLSKHRSHCLLIMSKAKSGNESDFLDWYQGVYQEKIVSDKQVLKGQLYEQHEVDITLGRHKPIPFHYMAIYDLCLDGAEQSEVLINTILTLHNEEPSAEEPAVWLYYPVSEKVGRDSTSKPSLLTLAFARGREGQEQVFKEFYATQHIRHALQVPALVSGQCFEKTVFQQPGALDTPYSTIAIYEQEGSPESIIESFKSLPPGSLPFPTLDPACFAEWVYKPLGAENTR